MINKPKAFRHYKDSVLFCISLGIAKIGDTKTINKIVFLLYLLDTFIFSY